ncbi:hypothetical protein [Actinokineospora bangkokensis]|uniref:Uncharacterized protein n=1 Tax=Actinokineospora bangkokensis TaxID=1193682 RepID=A0A1Q9LNI4_9PSEU|nr:hypothetical protein [Actinokineospora bangkokensis]OLR93575.1 hypothetical protein BJP25_14910 [Actinokineospora bangkokensis]
MALTAEQVTTRPVPSPAQVARIAAVADPVLRNLAITHCYHELSTALSRFTGAAANWCTFAVWASKQVGQTIRQEDARRFVERVLATSPALARAVAGLARRALPAEARTGVERLVHRSIATLARLDAASEAGARGNLKVFAEIAHEVAQFLDAFTDEEEFDEQRIGAFLATLRAGPPPSGQEYLRRAFAAYYRARFTADPKDRAELLLLGNVLIGLHEQTRLQPEIADALNAPVLDPREVERDLLERLPLLRPVLDRTPLLGVVVGAVAEVARLVTRRAITTVLMALALPDDSALDLSDDLTAAYPAELRELTNPDLLALLGQVDPTPDSLVGTAAADWADLPDRMHYIADMFRCYAVAETLFTPPFTPEQVAAFEAGRLPAGRL